MMIGVIIEKNIWRQPWYRQRQVWVDFLLIIA